MVACEIGETCAGWVHFECEELTREQIEDFDEEIYVCGRCEEEHGCYEDYINGLTMSDLSDGEEEENEENEEDPDAAGQDMDISESDAESAEHEVDLLVFGFNFPLP
jgi:hypothetical protein